MTAATQPRPSRSRRTPVGSGVAAFAADPRRVRWAGCVFFVLIGWVWALSSPLMSVPDEPAHTIRAAALAHGQLLGREVVENPNGFGERRTSVVEAPAAFATLESVGICFRFASEARASCDPPIGTDSTMVETTTAAGSYPPGYYAIVGWPSRLLEPTHAIYAMRLISALLCGIVLGWALGAVAALGRSGFATIGVAVATTPMVLFMAGSVNPNGLEIAAALCLWAVLIELLVRPGRIATSQWVRVAVAATFLTGARPLGPLFTVGILATVGLFVADRAAIRRLLTDRRGWACAVIVAAVGAATVYWTLSTGAFESLSSVPTPPVDSKAEAIRYSLEQTAYRYHQMIGWFGWLDTETPRVLAWLWLAAVSVVVAVATVVGTWRQRVGVALLIVATIAFPVLSEMQTAEELGFIWQGRYTLPVAVGVPILAGWIVATRAEAGRLLRLAVLTIPVGLALVHLVAWASMMTRYHSGASAPITSFFRWSNTWDAPLGNVVLTGVLVVALAGLTAAIVAAGRWRASVPLDLATGPVTSGGDPRAG